MQIEIVNLGIKIEAGKKSILQSLVENNIEINNFCNGRGTCGKCKIKVLQGEINHLTKSEANLLSDEEIKENIRLACLTYPKTDIKISIANINSDIKVLDQGQIPEFKMNTRKGLGIALDIGTTTIAMNLINLENGNILDKISAINPQSKYGLDVMTRITYEFENENAIKNLQEIIIQKINAMIDEICIKNNLEKENIKQIIVAANTTMLHMFLGKDARSLGKYPYKTSFVKTQTISAEDIGINLKAKIFTLANVSAFVGSDIVAGVYLTDLKNKKNTLFIDIGTNGEIVLKTKDKLYCCSTAAGPALEGMNIECGMRAESGAVERVKIENEKISIKSIGDTKAKGLCGSGLLSAVSEVIANNFVNKRGRIVDPNKLEANDYRKKYIKEDEKKGRIIILDENSKIYLSQKDIRQVQLAKGAILSGFITLLKTENMEISDLESVIIAGGFGSHLKKEDITGVGILPKQASDLITYVGNSSLIGAYMALMNNEIINQMEILSRKIQYIELSTTENYERTFAKAMQFN
ncbi:ASKHA domain-containing protein [uncultured Anaerococcus sp.]|uniref:ASKHA domain-containing protein n=1 Tax=Anaerococcus sp. AH8042_DFU013_CI05 TaxID=3385202 RepID=UPI0025DE0479|nr:ASKHA domain-containing protein [uncultured Anaerococcus sp.]